MQKYIILLLDVPLADISDVEAFTDIFLSSIPSSICGHTLTVAVSPSVALGVAPNGKPIVTTEELTCRALIQLTLAP